MNNTGDHTSSFGRQQARARRSPGDLMDQFRHDTPPALGLPTHRPGHALALGLDDQACGPWVQALIAAGYTVYGHLDKTTIGWPPEQR